MVDFYIKLLPELFIERRILYSSVDKNYKKVIK